MAKSQYEIPVASILDFLGLAPTYALSEKEFGAGRIATAWGDRTK
jgi:hypothetical protein